MKNKERIKYIISALNDGLFEREEVVAVVLLSALAQQNVFLYGPPGCAKSLISRRLSKVFKENTYFEQLMQKFSTPEEVFGPISIAELKKDNYIRKTEGFLPEADFVFLDEVWKSSPAILNTLLTVINEKKFKNGREVVDVPLKVLISASNETPPERQGLDALYDRFLTRLYVGPIGERASFEQILQSGGSDEHIELDESLKITNAELAEWGEKIRDVKLSKDTLHLINAVRLAIEEYNREHEKSPVYVSDRRWQRAAHLLKASAFFCDRKATNIVDCLLLSYVLWTNEADREMLAELVEEQVRENGFTTTECLAVLDDEKASLEAEIDKEMYHTKDVYDVKKLADKKQYYKWVFRKGNWSEQECYIPVAKKQTQGKFYPVDAQGNEVEWLKCDFDGQSSCKVFFNENGRRNSWCNGNEYNFREQDDPFVPTVLFHKGDKIEDVNERLIDQLSKAVEEQKEKYNKMLEAVRTKRGQLVNSIDTPFLQDKKVQIALEAVDKQIKDVELRIKDCDRLKKKV